MGENEFIIDRIENYIVVLEQERNMIEINIDLIQGPFNEGDVLIKNERFYEVDHEKTNLRKEKINSIMKGIWEE